MRCKVGMNKRFLLSTLFLSLGFSASQVLANSETTTFDVKIDIIAACEISTTTAGDLDFGQHGLNTTEDVNQQTQLSVACTKGAPYKIALDAGLHAGGTPNTNNRKMKGEGGAIANEFIAYQLYHTAARTSIWGYNETERVTGNGTGVSKQHIVYGQVKNADLVKAQIGSYRDTVTATVFF